MQDEILRLIHECTKGGCCCGDERANCRPCSLYPGPSYLNVLEKRCEQSFASVIGGKVN